jgi:two-component system response regulator FlrC
LRDRPSDLLPLSRHLLQEIGVRLGRTGLQLDRETEQQLQRYRWPGNVRELANVLERAAILTDGSLITADNLSLDESAGGRSDETPSGVEPLKDLERKAIQRALRASGGHRKQAAEMLGIGLRTLYDKLKTYGID